MVGPLLEAGVDKRIIDAYAEDLCYCYRDTTPLIQNVASVRTPHNVPNCAWKMQIGGEKVFYATDCSTLEGIEAKGYDLYLIEANHARADIEARISAKLAAGEFVYELEAMRNHLSEEQALAWLAENAGPNSKYQFLHQHIDKKEDQ